MPPALTLENPAKCTSSENPTRPALSSKRAVIEKIKQARIFMSPMSGITDSPFRSIIQKFGCKFAFTEMIDANGLFYNNLKTFKMLNKLPGDNIAFGVQITGEDENRLLRAAKICEEKGFSLLELNAGCPVKKVVRDGKGSALLKTPQKLGKIISRIVKELSIPVTVKLRSGWDTNNINCLEIAKIAESEGASAICIHPRTKAQMYKGVPDHNITRSVKDAVKIPVFASGDIFSPLDVKNVFAMTNCDAVVVARGALGKPWLFRQIYEFLSLGTIPPEPSFEELKSIILEHLSLCLDFFDNKKAFLIMHKHLMWYLKSFKRRSIVMNEYGKIRDMEKFKYFLDTLHVDEHGNLSLT